MTKKTELNSEWLEIIRNRVEGLSYGTVLLTVHDGRIVQIERTERERYEVAPAAVHRSKAR